MHPFKHVVVDQLRVLPGETVTVFVGKPDNQVQVELRVRPDGTPEIFASTPEQIQRYDDWEPMP